MTQVPEINLDPNISGLAQRVELNDFIRDIYSSHIGSGRPPAALKGTIWPKDTGGVTIPLYFFTGTDDILIGTFNTAANIFTPATQLETFANAVTSKTGTHTLLDANYGQLITCDATAGNLVSNLDAVDNLNSKWFAIIQKTDSSANLVTVDPAGSTPINGATTYVLKRQYEGVIVIKDSSVSPPEFRGIPVGNTDVVRVSSDDAAPGYLEDKIGAGNGIALSTSGGGVDESRNIAVALAANPGLEFNAGGIRAKAGTGIVRNADGINVDVGTTAGKIPQLNGSGQLPALDGSLLTNLASGFSSVQVFSGSGTWNRPSGVRKVLAVVTGGGGPGRSDSGAGASDGGTSSFGSHCSATGGVSGQGNLFPNGGNGVGGDINIAGGKARRPSGGCSIFGGEGAPGSGGGYLGTSGGAGSAGGTSIKLIDVTAISSVAVTIGAAGSPGDTGLPATGGYIIVFEFK